MANYTFGTPKGIIWMGTWRTLQPRRILAPGAISVYDSFRLASLEPGPSGQELRTLRTGQLRPSHTMDKKDYVIFSLIPIDLHKLETDLTLNWNVIIRL